MSFCFNCMSEKGLASVCPVCGFREEALETSPMFLPPGTVLNGRYLIGRVLGYGGFGITYLAFGLNLQIKLAIKEYLPQSLATRSMGAPPVSVYSGDAKDHFAYGLDKFLDEARTLAKFNNNPCIVSVLDFFKENNTAYLVMEYIDGITFKEYLDRHGGRISLDTALEIMNPVMDALREVHEIGLLHRDVSPDNVYITHQKQVKLLDFGAARFATGEQSKSLTVVLKPGYAPMEQYHSKGVQGPWTDVYAVGATIYRAIIGDAPPEALDRLQGDERAVVQEKLAVFGPDPRTAALLKALSVKAEGRFQTMDELQKVLSNRSSAPASGKDVPPAGNGPVEASVTCPSCRGRNRAADSFCTSCGAKLSVSARNDRRETVYCRSCGAPNVKGDRFCTTCSKPLLP